MEIARAILTATSTTDDRPWQSLGSGPKALVPVATKPILFHTLDALRSAGILEVALLSEPPATPLFEAAVEDGARWGMSIVHRACRADTDVRGALGLSANFVDDEPVLVQRADAIMRERLRDHIVGFSRDDLDALALMLRRAPSREALPRVAGGYLLSPQAVAIMLEAPTVHDPLLRLQRHGSQVRVLDVDGCLACHGDQSSLLEANRHALCHIETDVSQAVVEDCEIQGAVILHAGASLKNTLVRGPAIVGARTRIVDSYVGPYTSIGADARIEGTEIEHSIVMDRAQLVFVGSRLETSIIGRDATIVRRFEIPSAVRISVGDGAHIALC